MMIFKGIEELIGNTPLLEPQKYNKKTGALAKVYAKLECFNPAGSIKDRAVLSMIEEAEDAGLLKPGDTLIEPTSGNTGIGLAAIASAKGYKVIIVMPDNMSFERRALIKAYGAKVILTLSCDGMRGAIKKAEEIKEKTPDSIIVGQFVNPANPKAHFDTTGPEIYEDLEGNIDILVAGFGTGGTITGIGEFLKSKNPNIKIVAIEPALSPLLSKGQSGPHGLQGIGANFIPEILNKEIIDEIVTVTDEQAYAAARLFASSEGVLVGITSGAALHVATELAKCPENEGKNIVAILPDSGERYLSTPMYVNN
ncbi:MAG: cysteine synthase A [Ruminococcaceae bacterium]|nr:cysteine synthase A [Oscillospiraceae bacterium]